MAERVVPWDPRFKWEPNVPDAVLAVGDGGQAVLALNAHVDDANQDCVAFIWSSTRAAIMGPPSDEARSGHHLYRCGLSGLLWAGTVEESTWISDLERQNRVHPRHDAARLHSVDSFHPAAEGMHGRGRC